MVPKKLKFLDNSIVYIILGVVFAIGINQGLGIVLATDMPVVAVESGSMEPTFYRGDILVLQGVLDKDLAIGDVIVFSPNQGSTPVVHRIVSINDDGTFQTKGDANTGQLPFEKRIEKSQIHGKVALIIPYVGYLKLWISELIIPNILWIALSVGTLTLFAFAGKKHFRL